MSILIGNNLPPHVTEPWCMPQTLYTQSSVPARVRLVCDTLTQDEFDSVRAHVKAHHPGASVELCTTRDLLPPGPAERTVPRPTCQEEMVPAGVQRGEVSTRSLAWYTELFNHALHSVRPKACCVLWGAPGTGKTLAAEHLLEEVTRLRTKAQCAENTLRRHAAQVPAMRYFSCAALEAACDLGPFLGDIAEFGATAHPDDIVVVDDIEALGGRTKRERLFEVLARRVRCRRILITNDFYDAKNFGMRQSGLKDFFFSLPVARAHIDSLSQYLTQHFPTLAGAAAQRIACQSRGDVRAALTAAALDERMLAVAAAASESVEKKQDEDEKKNKKTKPKKASTGISIDVQHRSEALHVSLQRLARTAERTTLVCAHKMLADAEQESAAESLFANYARMLTALPDEEREVDAAAESLVRMQAAADAADLLSLGEQYDWHRREHSYAGTDGIETDKEVVFALTVGAPLTRVARAIRRSTKHHGAAPCLDFPFYALGAQQKATAEALRPLWARMHGPVHQRGGAATSTQQSFSGNTFALLEDAKALLFGGLRGTALRNVIESEPASEKLVALVQRFVEFGADEQVFVCMCRARMGEHKYSEKRLGEVFRECNPKAPAAAAGLSKKRTASSTVQTGSEGSAKSKKTTGGKKRKLDSAPPAKVSVLNMMRRMSKPIVN